MAAASGINLQELPRDTISNVCSFLAPKDLRAAAQVSGIITPIAYQALYPEKEVKWTLRVLEAFARRPSFDSLRGTQNFVELVVHAPEGMPVEEAIAVSSRVTEIVKKFFKFHNNPYTLDQLLSFGLGRVDSVTIMMARRDERKIRDKIACPADLFKKISDKAWPNS